MKIGVALSSGGAAGLAHVGVLEELQSAGIQVECAAGTSAGATVGAAWAAGHLDEFSSTMCSLTRRGVFALFDPTWPRTGFLEGRRLVELVRPFIGDTIEALPRGYAAVATELSSGKEIVLRKGRVADAVRASAAVPGLLMPESINGRLLVDGGLVNPIPVDVARSLGADFVIAVSVLGLIDRTVSEDARHETPGLAAQWLAKIFPSSSSHDVDDEKGHAPEEAGEADELGLIEIMSRASKIVQARLAEERLVTNPPDAIIKIHLPDISLFEFDRSKEAVEAGREAARAALPSIRSALEEAGSVSGKVSRWLKAK